MDAKIPPGAPGAGVVDAVEGLADAAENVGAAAGSDSVEGLADLSTDAVAAVAEQVARGEITSSEAVDRLLAGVLESEAVTTIPDTAREELAHVLASLLETDPYLKSLVASLGPDGEKR